LIEGQFWIKKRGVFLAPLFVFVSLGTTTACGAGDRPEYQAELLETYSAPHARQGVAVDNQHFYPVTNFALSKYDKTTGKMIAEWSGAAEGDPLTHMDSLMEWGGMLYASHSNYPIFPMTSSVEVWDANTMQHVESHSFGVNRGSLTWLDRHDGQWWGAFANYDKVQQGQAEPYGRTNNTQVVRFSNDFVVVEAWTIPLEILDRMRPMSNSGGSWGDDGYLYLTGHDHGELYVMQIPEAGSELVWFATIKVPVMEGQGIAWDRTSDDRILWAIYKKERQVLKIHVPEIDAGAQ
jgi:hypothetical protein